MAAGIPARSIRRLPITMHTRNCRRRQDHKHNCQMMPKNPQIGSHSVSEIHFKEINTRFSRTSHSFLQNLLKFKPTVTLFKKAALSFSQILTFSMEETLSVEQEATCCSLCKHKTGNEDKETTHTRQGGLISTGGVITSDRKSTRKSSKTTVLLFKFLLK